LRFGRFCGARGSAFTSPVRVPRPCGLRKGGAFTLPGSFLRLSSRIRSPAFWRTAVRDLLLLHSRRCRTLAVSAGIGILTLASLSSPVIPNQVARLWRTAVRDLLLPHRPRPRHLRPHQASRRIPRPPQSALRRLLRRLPGRRPPSHPSHERQHFARVETQLRLLWTTEPQQPASWFSAKGEVKPRWRA